MDKKKDLSGYGFIAPHLIFFSIFFVVPAVFGIFISFTKWNMYGTPEWVGLKNYYEILVNTESIFYEQFQNGLKNTFLFAILSVPFCIIIPLIIATALNNKPKGHKLFQSVFYVPGLLSISAVMLAWNFMFNKTFGFVNNVFGLDITWTSQVPFTWVALIIITIWWCIGGNMIIYRAALANVPTDYYEAARIDGAGEVRQFFSITLPSIKEQIIYTTVMTTIAQFNIYGQPYMFNNGGPGQSNSVLMMYIRELAFGRGESIAGLASAMAIMLGLCILAVVALQNFILRDKDNVKKKKKGNKINVFRGKKNSVNITQ